MAVKKIEHIGIMVASLNASIPFYENVLGLKHLYTLNPGNGPVKLAFLAFPDAEETQIELVEGISTAFPAEGKVHHAAFSVDDIEEEFKRLKELDVPLRDTEITTLPNGARYFFLYGPDGELLELFQPGQTS